MIQLKYTIVMPTYDNTSYIKDCIQSIYTSFNGLDFELLIGIDNCGATLKLVNYLKSYDYSKVYMSTKNVGPYVIKNSLLEEASGDHFIFFDSDDVMHKDLGKAYDNLARSEDYIRFKFYNFKKSIKQHFPAELTTAEGVFGISRKYFTILECFKPWRCAADSEFYYRARGKGLSYKVLDKVAFFRRLHDKNLTVDKATGINSELRSGYAKIIGEMNSNQDYSNPTITRVELIKL